MKLMPASRAFAMMRPEVASSVGPPNIMVPRQIGETFRPLRPSWRYCIRLSSHRHSGAMRSIEPGISRFPDAQLRICGLVLTHHPGTTVSTLVLQNLEHAARHRDDALVDGDFRGDEDQAPRRAYHMRPRDKRLADLARLDEMRVELHGRHRGLAGDVARGHAA